jgi:ribosomal protein L18E
VVVVVIVSEVVGNATFIHVKIVIRLVFSAEEDNKIEKNDMSLCSFIKNE